MTADRRAAIVRLLETRDQHLPDQLRRRSDVAAGFVHTTVVRESCPDCLANGRVLKGCETCKGRGWVEERRSRDPYATELVLPYGWSADRHERRRELDAQIGRLEQQTREPWTSAADELADANVHPYGWELARRRMYAAYDYGPLDLALDALRLADETCYHALHACHVYGWQVGWSAPLEAIVEAGLEFLDVRLPTPIRAPGMVSDGVAA